LATFLSFVMLLGAVLFSAVPGYSLTADEIAVIANKQEPDSISLARFYMDQRRIPAGNLITIDIDPAEDCRRSDYDNLIAAPVLSFLNKHSPKNNIRCLVTMYGVPLKITSPSLSDQGSETIAQLTKKIEEITLSLDHNKDESMLDTLRGKISDIKKQISYYNKVNDMRAAVDSELTLVLQTHPLAHWLQNPYYRDQHADFLLFGKEDVLMVSRFGASSPDLVKRMITDSLSAEKEGLHGEAFFDARWPDPGLQQVNSYSWYDRAIHRAAPRLSDKATRWTGWLLMKKAPCFILALRAMLLSTAAGTVWPSTSTPLTGRKGLSAIISPAANAALCKRREARSGARECWKKGWPPPLVRWGNPMWTPFRRRISFLPFSPAAKIWWRAIFSACPISPGRWC
jgi:uncharacterized protein (TIGR03790 family)